MCPVSKSARCKERYGSRKTIAVRWRHFARHVSFPISFASKKWRSTTWPTGRSSTRQTSKFNVWNKCSVVTVFSTFRSRRFSRWIGRKHRSPRRRLSCNFSPVTKHPYGHGFMLRNSTPACSVWSLNRSTIVTLKRCMLWSPSTRSILFWKKLPSHRRPTISFYALNSPTSSSRISQVGRVSQRGLTIDLSLCRDESWFDDGFEESTRFKTIRSTVTHSRVVARIEWGESPRSSRWVRLLSLPRCTSYGSSPSSVLFFNQLIVRAAGEISRESAIVLRNVIVCPSSLNKTVTHYSGMTNILRWAVFTLRRYDQSGEVDSVRGKPWPRLWTSPLFTQRNGLIGISQYLLMYLCDVNIFLHVCRSSAM